jgi:hypothetical protein
VSEVLVGPDGVRVERIVVQRQLTGRAGRCSAFAGARDWWRTVRPSPVAELVDLATLVPEQRAYVWTPLLAECSGLFGSGLLRP